MQNILNAFPRVDSSTIDIFLSNQDNWITIGYLGGGSFVLLLLLGITNTVIVYRDVPDFLWSLSLILIPITTFIVLALLHPEQTPEDYNPFWDNTQQRVVFISGAAFTAFAVLKTFINCVSNNGIIFGSVMFIFKVLAAGLCVLVCLGIFNKLFEKDRSIKNVLIAMIIFGVFSFFVNRLINGDKVLRRRAMAQH